MHFSTAVRSLAALVAAVSATPAGSRNTHVVHEKRDHIPHGWFRRTRVHEQAIIPVRIGLTQSNLHRADEFIIQVSHPDSPEYGRHWSPEKIAAMFSPTPTTVNIVKTWLYEFGIHPAAIQVSASRGWLTFNATTTEVEQLLKAEYHIYSHNGGVQHIACDSYSIPAHVAEHIDIITPTIHFDQKIGHERKHVHHPLPPKAAQELKRRRITQPLRRQENSTNDDGTQPQDPQDPQDSQDPQNPPAPEQPADPQDPQDPQNPTDPQDPPSVDDAPPGNDTLMPDVAPSGIAHGIIGAADDPSNPKQGAIVNNALINLDSCDSMIIPECLRALYAWPQNTKAKNGNSLGVVEYTPQAYLQEDLDLWFKQFSPAQVGIAPITELIDGAIVQREEKSFDLNGESALDLQYAMALVYPQTVTLYQVGDVVAGASFNNFLDALDGSYCTFQGGDSKDPGVDGQYPDTQRGGYNGPKACGTLKSTNVISTSYSSNEADLSSKYVQRQCAEYMKLGLQGVSVLYSSGDFGVGGNGGNCISPTTGAYQNANASNGIFNPSFPGTCPYITSIGATQVLPGSTVRSPESASNKAIFSGGGFSNVFPMPSYQNSAVAAYYNNSMPSYGSDRYNNSQRVRGYPDISANGVNYVVAVDGNFSLIFGTSASCPVVAAMINDINEERLAVGKGSVGFINTALYQNPDVLNDITSGGNRGCSTPGFQAVQGWDPVTGLGTPNYPRMLKLFMGLP